MKKLLIIGAIGLLIYNFKDKIFGTNETQNNETNDTDDGDVPGQVLQNVPLLDALGNPRQLTDDEAISYLKNNPDVDQAWNAPVTQEAWGTKLNWAKGHWFSAGYKEKRTV